MASEPRLTRRQAAGLIGLGSIGLLAGCRDDAPWNSVEVKGALPALSFTLSSAREGRAVTEADYAGRLVILFFGYTNCPDVCPLTMGNLMQVLERMGDKGRDVSVLFVTVDPNRDTLPVLKTYAEALDPRVDGLRGTDNQLAALTRLYRVTYRVFPATATQPYTVIHGPSVYVFDRRGKARLMQPRFYDDKAPIEGLTKDMLRLKAEPA